MEINLRNVLEDLNTKAKQVKSKIVLVYKNRIIGVDEEASYLKIIGYDNIHNLFMIYVQKEMSNFLNGINMLDTIEIVENKLICSNNTEIVIKNDKFALNIINSVNRSEQICASTCNYYKNQLEKDDIFIDLINRKTGEGAKFYKINDKYILSLFKGLLPINKGDKTDLSIFDCGQVYDRDGKMNIIFLCKFYIIKKQKKNDNITVYIMYRTLK